MPPCPPLGAPAPPRVALTHLGGARPIPDNRRSPGIHAGDPGTRSRTGGTRPSPDNRPSPGIHAGDPGTRSRTGGTDKLRLSVDCATRPVRTPHGSGGPGRRSDRYAVPDPEPPTEVGGPVCTRGHTTEMRRATDKLRLSVPPCYPCLLLFHPARQTHTCWSVVKCSTPAQSQSGCPCAPGGSDQLCWSVVPIPFTSPGCRDVPCPSAANSRTGHLDAAAAGKQLGPINNCVKKRMAAAFRAAAIRTHMATKIVAGR